MSDPDLTFCEIDPATGRCATCADEGVEARVLSLRDGALAEVEMAGRVREVATDLLEEVGVGDRVLVHAGVAIAHLGRHPAAPTKQDG